MKFTKMVAAGNDFILYNGFDYTVNNYSNLAKKSCNRHFGIGADGIMVCEKSDVADIKMIYYNSDGSRGEMCGNGIRCFSKYIYENKILNKKSFTIETLAGIKTIWLEINDDTVEIIKVNMGVPIFESNMIPVSIDSDEVLLESIVIDGINIMFSSVLVGVPHTVIFVDDIKHVDINGLGEKLESHSIFPEKTNVNFVEILDRNNINIYTWERGAGRTLGCGTGSCASVVLGKKLGKLNNIVNVKTEGGQLQVELKDNYNIYMKGGATTICTGKMLDL
ncbi:MAG: diaminopimelate epimerase [Clostridiaceae bacterium]|nr:diaminopimelate epimerase [Clostridiaceae bacterium]MBW4858892.1 diaminopimelate epimerase [Clostridiaceae bacterium]MBW4869467.1 diaminopimelate epimerase [Clostridiaceae bacterium]